MSNIKITQLNALTAIDDADLLEIVDTSDTTMSVLGTNKKITKADLIKDLKDKTETLTNKTLTSPDITSPAISGGTITSATLTDATINGTLTGTAGFGAWTSYVPTLTYITLGNGTLTGYYNIIGKTVFWRASILFGTTTAITNSNAQISLPVTARAGQAILGTTMLYDRSITTYFTGTMPGIVVGFNQVAGAYISLGGTSATAPFTWTTGDEMYVSGTYEAE